MKNINDKQIKAWKEQYGGVYLLEVDAKKAYLKAPTMLDWKRATSAMLKDGEIAFFENLLKACWLEGDSIIKTDDAYFLSAKNAIKELFEYEDAQYEKKGDHYQITLNEHRCIVRPITKKDIELSERKNKSGKPFVEQEWLFKAIVIESDPVFEDQNNAEIRMPLYRVLEELKNTKIERIKKL